MRKYVLVVLLALGLSGCMVGSSAMGQPYAEEELYKGYPCRKNCEAFRRGFDAAEEAGTIDPQMCTQDDMVERNGCMSYAHEDWAERTVGGLIDDPLR